MLERLRCFDFTVFDKCGDDIFKHQTKQVKKRYKEKKREQSLSINLNSLVIPITTHKANIFHLPLN